MTMLYTPPIMPGGGINKDPPVGVPVIQGQPDGTLVVLPLANFNYPGDDAGPINAALIQAAGTGQVNAWLGGNGQTGGRVQLAPNQVYNVQSTISVPPGCTLESTGRGAVLAFSGTGPCVYAHGDQTGSQVIQGVGSIIRCLTIDGTNVAPTATARALDAGDQFSIVLEDVTVQNFTSTGTTGNSGAQPLGAVGFCINIITTLTEKLYMRRCTVNNCGTPNLGAGATPNSGGGAALQFVTTSGNSTSHMYHDIDIHINQQEGQNGFVIAHNGHLMNGRFVMRGNMQCPAAGTVNGSAAIVIGVGVGSPTPGHIQREWFDVHVESDPTASGATQPWTIYAAGNADNTMTACEGRLQFLDGFQNSNLVTNAPGNFVFFGPITGDTNLSGVSATSGNGQPANASGCAIIPAALTGITPVVSNGHVNISPNAADLFIVTLGAPQGIIILNNDGGLGGAQRKTFIISQPATGGTYNYTVTWPQNTGGATLANPTVNWPGGVAPTQSTGPGATDWYELVTIDGANWYGVQHPGMATP